MTCNNTHTPTPSHFWKLLERRRKLLISSVFEFSAVAISKSQLITIEAICTFCTGAREIYDCLTIFCVFRLKQKQNMIVCQTMAGISAYRRLWTV